MLIEAHDLELVTPACHPGAERFAAKAQVITDLAPVLPYLNAILRGAVYQPVAQVVTWKKGKHAVAFRAHEIATSNVEDRAQAAQEIEELVALVNRTWERRAEITPDHTAHERPVAMAVFKRLPQTNCRYCGEPTCFSFALKLTAAQKTVAECAPLSEAGNADRLAALQAMFADEREIYVAE